MRVFDTGQIGLFEGDLFAEMVLDCRLIRGYCGCYKGGKER